MAEKTYYGLYQGIVTKIDDPEKRGRIKVKIPTVLGGDTESAWCDPLVTVAYDYGGDFCIPQIKEAVWVMFIAGDANKPVYLGGWWQKEQTPLGTTYDRLDDTRIISYKDFKITIHEGTATISVLNVPDHIIMGSDGIKLQDGTGNTITMSKGGITLSSPVAIKFSAPRIDLN